VTPFGTRLKDRLDAEVMRMQNEWFFKWHQLKTSTGVQVDGFDGREIRIVGVEYWGSTRDVYWATLQRYLSVKLGEYFDSTVEAIERFPNKLSEQMIGEFDQLLKNFCARIAEAAVEKDKVLRGNGFEFPPLDMGRRSEIYRDFNLAEKVAALKALLQANYELDERVQSRDKSNPVQIVVLPDSEAFRELKTSIELLIQKVSHSNSIGSEVPVEKAQHLAELRAAKELLNAPQVEKDSFSLVVGRALKWVSEKAAGTAISEIIKAVVTALIKMGI
jgi:hypothetical protein